MAEVDYDDIELRRRLRAADKVIIDLESEIAQLRDTIIRLRDICSEAQTYIAHSSTCPQAWTDKDCVCGCSQMWLKLEGA